MLKRYRHFCSSCGRVAYTEGFGFCAFPEGHGFIWRFAYDTPSVFWIRCPFEVLDRLQDSPATVLLRHRLGRRVAAEAGPATMLLRYRLGTRLVGVALHTFL